jgi:hypothetical protein
VTARRVEIKADPAYWRAFSELMSRIEAALGGYRGPAVPAYVAGGAATHIYTGSRLSADVDATLGGRLLLPDDLQVMYKSQDGKHRTLYFDRQYNDTLGLMHEDAYADSMPYGSCPRSTWPYRSSRATPIPTGTTSRPSPAPASWTRKAFGSAPRRHSSDISDA